MAGTRKTISYRYDSVRNRVGMTDSDGGRFTYAYDSVNRMTHMVNPQGERTTYAYDPAGRRTVKKLANGTRASFSYDAAGNLTRLANLKSDGTTISSFNYDYDKVGNRTAVLEADGSRVTWSYDDTYQLTGEHRTGSNAYRDTYTYDPAGNRLLKIHDGARTSYSYDAANQLEWSEDASGRTTYMFDADGNQELVVEPSVDRTTTSWDYENRTTLVELPSGVRNTMAYEPDGLRVKLEESTGIKKFVWDEQNYLAETDGNDDTQVVYTNEPRLYGNLVSQRRRSDTHWYHFDAIGSTRELTDSSEIVTDTRFYDAWGAVLHSTGSTSFVFLSFGQVGYYSQVDWSGMYVRARSYIPARGSWMAVDAAGRMRVLNAYAYVKNAPTMALDPSGWQPLPPDVPPPPPSQIANGGPSVKIVLPEAVDPCPPWCPGCDLSKAVFLPCSRNGIVDLPIVPFPEKVPYDPDRQQDYRWIKQYHLPQTFRQTGVTDPNTCCTFDLEIVLSFFRCDRRDGPFKGDGGVGYVGCHGKVGVKADPWNNALTTLVNVQIRNSTCGEDQSYFQFCPLVVGIHEHTLGGCIDGGSTHFVPTNWYDVDHVASELCDLIAQLHPGDPNKGPCPDGLPSAGKTLPPSN
ncbi:MAG: RHS repeat protein [Planctomycetota bacterium]|nr:MAG: RHS repeat protein [Planctomycetota bacterium]REJ91933.1 MAG: RHS repeat protein [Planctomycetota bacterium]REK27340.1 MAG: RHS repeat protein [Planctomycetota bacterium]REK36638.1 MAG: RHS repeat protein [Planctomycetota bacterium]